MNSKKQNKRVFVFDDDVLATNFIFTSYRDAKKYVEENSNDENHLVIRRFTNRSILRKIRDMIGREDANSSILRLLDVVISDTEN